VLSDLRVWKHLRAGPSSATMNLMNWRQKIALLLGGVVLVVSGAALMNGEFGAAALGVFLSASALVSNFRIWPSKSRWKRKNY
jgi:hypothetical protein